MKNTALVSVTHTKTMVMFSLNDRLGFSSELPGVGVGRSKSKNSMPITNQHHVGKYMTKTIIRINQSNIPMGKSIARD